MLGADSFGSIGFSQIKNKFKYGELSQASGLAEINLYDPKQAVKGFALWSNTKEMGEGFYYAFSTEKYLHPTPYPEGSYPKLADSLFQGGQYKPEFLAADKLSKGIAAYKGAYATVLSTVTWPEMIRNHPYSEVSDSQKLIKYVLQIKQTAELPLRTWTWILNAEGTSCEYGEIEWLEDKKTFQQICNQ